MWRRPRGLAPRSLLVLIAVLALLVCTAWATKSLYDGLTPEQIAELKQLKAKLKAERAQAQSKAAEAAELKAKQQAMLNQRANRPQRAEATAKRYEQLENERASMRDSVARRQFSAARRNRETKSSRTHAKEKRRTAQAEVKERRTRRDITKMVKMSPQVYDEAKSNLDWMRKRAMDSSDGLVRLTTEEFLTRVHSSPRPYWASVTFTALTGSGIPCPACDDFHKITHVPLALRNKAALATQPGAKIPLEIDATLSDFPVFYVILEPQAARELWIELNLKQAPFTFVYPPSHTSKKRSISDLRRYIGRLPSTMRLNPTSEPDPKSLPKFIARNIGAELPHLEASDSTSGKDKVPVVPAVLLLLGIAAVGAAIFVFWEYVIILRRFTLPYCLVAWAGYIFGTSGFMYNRLNNVPWAGASPQGPRYVNPGYNTQYGAESAIVAAINVLLAALTVTLVILVVPGKLPMKLTLNAEAEAEVEADTESANADLDSKKKTPAKPGKDTKSALSGIEALLETVRVKLLSNPIVPLVLVGGFTYLWYQNLDLYTFKNRGYRHGRVW